MRRAGRHRSGRGRRRAAPVRPAQQARRCQSAARAGVLRQVACSPSLPPRTPAPHLASNLRPKILLPLMLAQSVVRVGWRYRLLHQYDPCKKLVAASLLLLQVHQVACFDAMCGQACCRALAACTLPGSIVPTPQMGHVRKRARLSPKVLRVTSAKQSICATPSSAARYSRAAGGVLVAWP